ncbi:MAG: hypothetical protein BAJALOKI2v1_270022 [Promethearchaeota archaeon]|nr:MAG: hypothetical protein BAJALOKI2v1_270022 [Candidatus Lokiarchaeota archaeon]
MERHHADEDKEYYALFDLETSGALQIKLFPLSDRSMGECPIRKLRTRSRQM